MDQNKADLQADTQEATHSEVRSALGEETSVPRPEVLDDDELKVRDDRSTASHQPNCFFRPVYRKQRKSKKRGMSASVPEIGT